MKVFVASTMLVAIAEIGDNTLRNSLLRRRLMLAQPA
jgi:putative Ca2+/H+ antiporter (TMEM165/GDT1 family)